MARRRNRKASKGGIFSALGRAFRGGAGLVARAIPPAVIMVLAGTLFFGVREALYADTSFAVQRVNVNPPDALSDSAHQYLQSQFLGKNILKVNVGGVAEELERDSRIRQARIIRNFPDELNVQIEERKPIGMIQFAPGDAYAVIATDGVVLDILPKRTESLIHFEAFQAQRSRATVGVNNAPPGFPAAVEFIQAYWRHPVALKEPVTKVSLDRLGNVTVTLGSGPPLRLGRKPSDRMEAIEKLIPVMEGEARTRIEYVDLQFDDVIVKRRK